MEQLLDYAGARLRKKQGCCGCRSSSCRSSVRFRSLSCKSYSIAASKRKSFNLVPWNSLPSGRTMGTSGAAASAERDPDSLEREDDSLLLPCLLELFLSHMSLAKSPPCTTSFASSSQPLTHDLSSPPRRAIWLDQRPKPWQKPAGRPCQRTVLRLFQRVSLCWRPVLKRSVSLHWAAVLALTLIQINWTLAWFVSIFILYTKCPLLFPLMLNTRKHTCTHTDYILI